jgi:hypothetical protein
MRSVWDLIDKFNHDEQLGLIITATPENLYEGKVSDT